MYTVHIQKLINTRKHTWIALSAAAVEYIDGVSAEGLDPSSNDCPGNDTKPSYDEDPVLELSKMWSTSSMPLLPGPL